MEYQCVQDVEVLAGRKLLYTKNGNKGFRTRTMR